MLKRILFFLLLSISITLANNALAKAKECLVKPRYDIVINKQYVQVVNDVDDLNIKLDGSVILNGEQSNIKPLIQKEAKNFQAFLRKELPIYESRANAQLDEANLAFEKAIREKLGNNSELLKNLANLHDQLVALLHKSIISKDGVTYFYYKPFNNLKKDGEAISEKIFYKILGNSILNFNLFKNYSAIKKIAKEEWKSEKTVLQEFDDYVCDLMAQIDDQYNHLLIGIK